MNKEVTALLLAAILLLLFDIPWLMVSGPYVKSMIQRIQDSALQVQYIPAIIVYLAMAYLILQTNTPLQAFYTGMATYAVYDFTNLATLKNYDFSFALLDSLWGGTLFAITRFVLNRI